MINLSTTSMFRLTLIGLVAMSACVVAGAATPATAPDVSPQIVLTGLGSTVPTSTRMFLKGVTTYCSQWGDAPATAFTFAYAEWLRRHQQYLLESARVKADLLASLARPGSPPDGVQRINHLHAVEIPAMVAAKIARNTAPVEALPDAEAKAAACIEFAHKINDGQWDLKKNQPAVARFLDGRLQRRLH